MMNEDDYRHFVCIVAGNNPDELLKTYDKTIEVDPYVVYSYADADKLRNYYVEYYKEARDSNVNESVKHDLDLIVKDYESMDIDDFYYELTRDYDLNPATGDAISTQNPKGKYSYCNLGKLFCVPFLTKDGQEVFQAVKSDIDWPRVHRGNGVVYQRAWEMVMEGSKPENEQEESIYENMKDKTEYFSKFETKENYITSNTAFWGYAFLSDKTGWIDADDISDQFVWMSNFYETFIKNLPDDTLLSIYECVK